jgi:hypothetical protein
MRAHQEHPEDVTEFVPRPATGYTDPHETTGSEAETTVVPIRGRFGKWRMWCEDGWWIAIQPLEIDGEETEPLFRNHKGEPEHAFASRDGRRVLTELQLALAKAAA